MAQRNSKPQEDALKALREENASLRAQARRSEQLLEAIIDNSSTVIHLRDREGRYLLVNRLYEEIFAPSEESLLGKTVYDVFPKATADALRANDQSVLEAGHPLEMEEAAPQENGM